MADIFDLLKPEEGDCVPSLLANPPAHAGIQAQYALVLETLKAQLQLVQDELQLLKPFEADFDPSARLTHLWCEVTGMLLCDAGDVGDNFKFGVGYLKVMREQDYEYFSQRKFCIQCLEASYAATAKYEADREQRRNLPENVARRERANAKIKATAAKRRACTHRNQRYVHSSTCGSYTVCHDCGKSLTKRDYSTIEPY